MKKPMSTVVFLALALTPGAVGQVLPPEEHLGFPVGQDRKLADWGQIAGYFLHLGRASSRVRMEEVGRSTGDRPFLLAVISSPQNLARLEEFQEIQKRLADPRQVGEDLGELLERGRTVVLVTCGIHSTEVASPQTAMELAYELAVGEDAETREILENTIFLLVPSLNPDGVDIVNHWYWRTVGTAAEGTSPPELYHLYTGHDNNRDWFMFTQQETRLTVDEIHNRWHPQIVMDLHQMGSTGARMFVPPYIDPIDSNVDPLLQGQIVELGSSIFSALLAAGKKGVVINAIFDAYTPSRAYSHYHGGVRILSEAASARLASPVTIAPGQLGPGRNYDAGKPSWNFPRPWKGGEWRLRDIVQYQKLAVRACLSHAARYRDRWLRNFYQLGANALGREAPFAFVIPAEQPDPQGLWDLLGVLERGLVEIHRARADFEVGRALSVSRPLGESGRRSFSAGSYVIPLRQPYGAFAKTLLEVQVYPELREYPGGPLARPYDVTAHTLGMLLGVEVYQVDSEFQAPLERLEALPPARGRIEGGGDYWLFSHTNNAFALLANRLLGRGYPVYWAPNGFRAEGKGYPVGTLMSRGGADVRELEELISDLPVVMERVPNWPQLAWQQIRLPRLGLYRSHLPSMDEGWTRWVLEAYEFPYTGLTDADVRRGSLEGYDVIVIPDQSPVAIREGLQVPYPEEFSHGLGEQGIERLKAFAEAGGTLVFLGQASRLPLEEWKADLELEEVTENLSPQEFYVPGSLLRARVHNRHPVGYGVSDETALLYLNNPVFAVKEGLSVVSYPEEGLLLSGWMNGETHLAGKTALAEVPLGRGRLVLIGFRTQFRAQARVTYKFLFNSLYYATIR